MKLKPLGKHPKVFFPRYSINSDLSSVNGSEQVQEIRKIPRAFRLIEDFNSDAGASINSYQLNVEGGARPVKETEKPFFFASNSEAYDGNYDNEQQYENEGYSPNEYWDETYNQNPNFSNLIQMN